MTPTTEEDILQSMRRLFALLSSAPVEKVIPSDPEDDDPFLGESFVVVKVTTFARRIGLTERVRDWDSGTSTLTENVVGLRESIVRFNAIGGDAVDWLREFDGALGSTLSLRWLRAPVVADAPEVTIDQIGIQYGGSILSTSSVVGTSYQKRAVRDIVVSHGSHTGRVVNYADSVSVDITVSEDGGDITQTMVAP